MISRKLKIKKKEKLEEKNKINKTVRDWGKKSTKTKKLINKKSKNFTLQKKKKENSITKFPTQDF